jgi:DNA-binding transcriptional LysR family regulator
VLDVRRLRLLSELSRRGTIVEVARAVGYTPSAVSQSLAQLEREAGVALLERDGRRVRLTRAAHALVARADRVLAELDAAEAELATEHETVRGTVVIGAFPSAAARIVLPAREELTGRHPDIECVVREHEPEDGTPLLRAGELDVLVTETYTGVGPGPIGGLETHPLLSEPLLLLVPASDRAAEPVPLARYRDAAWIGGLPGTQYATAIERSCLAAGFAPTIAHRADEAMLIEELAAAGLGVGLLPALARSDREGLRYLQPTPTPAAREVFVLVRRGAARRPALAATLDALRAAASRCSPPAVTGGAATRPR